MKTEPREEHELENGLVLKLYDKSRPLAGDRWMVVFRAEIRVYVSPDHFPAGDTDAPDYNQVHGILGETAVFSYQKERHFVDQDDRREVWDELKNVFLANVRAYVSSPDFARRLILRRYKEAAGLAPRWGSKTA